MARVAGYIRKSDREREGTPLQTQRQQIQDWCKRESHELIGLYEDPDTRNTVPVHQREGGGRLLRDAGRGCFDVVVVYRVDRWARKGIVSEMAYEVLKSYGVGLTSATEPIDFSTPEGKLMLTMLVGLAEWERDTIEARCTEGMRRRAGQGLYCGGVTPYGYRVIDGRLQRDTEPFPNLSLCESGAVQLMFEGSCGWWG